jgi:Guanine nucleotide exchange factor synembryn.
MDIVEGLISLNKDITNELIKEECLQKVKEFTKNNSTVFEFSNTLNVTEYTKLNEAIFKLLDNSPLKGVLRLEILVLLRLLSRDKKLVNGIKDMKCCIVCFEKFLSKNDEHSKDDVECSVEILKCLCNWIYHSGDARNCFTEMNITEKMIANIRKGFQLDNYLYFQLRLLFLMPAFESEERIRLIDCGALNEFTKIMEAILTDIKKRYFYIFAFLTIPLHTCMKQNHI